MTPSAAIGPTSAKLQNGGRANGVTEPPASAWAAQRAMVGGINRLFAGWYGFPRPVVCAVNGHAIAGGLILALCADRRVGTHHGRYGLTELAVGIPYPVVALAVVRAELTVAAARRLALGAELVGPREALELGCLDELVDDPLARVLFPVWAR